MNSKHGPTQAALAAQARARTDAENRTRQVERDSRARMENAEKQAESVEQEMAARIEEARKKADSAVEIEESKRDKLLGRIKNETYKDVADIKRKTAAELARVRSESERDLTSTKETYEDQIELADHEGQKELRDHLKRNATMQAYQERAAENERQLLNKSHSEELAHLEQSQSERREQLQHEAELEISQLRGRTDAGRLGAEKHFESAYSSTLKANAEALARASTEGKRQLDGLRADHAQKLARYEERLEDPFYRMVDLELNLSDRGEHYTLEARIPEHEREHVKVTLRGNSIVVSGARRNEEKLELGDGKSRKVASYQTYHESLPLEWPVEPKGIVQEFEGDRLVVTLPKKGAYTDPVSNEKRPLEKAPYVAARAPRPDFPTDIPGAAPRRSDKPLSGS